MKHYRIAAAAAALMMTLAAFSSCGTSMVKNEAIDTDSADSQAASESAAEDSSTEEVEASEDQQVNFEAIEVPYVEYEKTYQAESGTLVGDTAEIKTERASFKGEGYVAGATLENWSLSFDLPESQFYNITVAAAANKAVNCRLYVNGREVWIFRANSEGSFEEKVLENIWLEEGINEITMRSTDNAADIDYITVTANKEVSSLSPDLSDAALSNEDADYNAKALYSLLCSNYGKQILTAQYDTAGGNAETELAAAVAEKYPAIRCSDIGGYTKGNPKDVSVARRYVKAGGIIAYDWYWLDPSDETEGVEIASVNFDLTKAMPEIIESENGDSYPDDLTEEQQSAGSQAAELTVSELEYSVEEMAAWTQDQIDYYYAIGEISDECYAILEDIDIIAGKLKALKKDGTPVLWRPLPVASNGLYWWGVDKDAYIWLWQLMYERMTEYHELNNLVWVWSAQNADWYVGDEYCDVLSVDIYSDGNRDAQINTLLFLHNICKTKPLAMSECGNLPAMESVLQEKAFWSYTALWTQPYIGEELGLELEAAESESAQSRFKLYYNNNYTLTRDELPNLKEVAKELKKQDKEKDKDKDKDSNSNSDSESDS